MNSTAPIRQQTTGFDAEDPVLGARPLLPGALSPVFGQRDEWNLNGVLRRPANLHPAGWKMMFAAFDEVWNLLAREMSMISLNPRHPRAVTAGISAPRRPVSPRTVIAKLGDLRALRAWAAERGLPPHPAAWPAHQMHVRVAELREELSPSTVVSHVKTIQELHRYGPLLTGGGLPTDPWPGMSARAVAGERQSNSTRVLSTAVIPPEVWFPLIRAAWTYIDQFGPDILRADQRLRQLRDESVNTSVGAEHRLLSWLSNPDNAVPVHHDRRPFCKADAGKIHWNLLSWLIGIDTRAHVFNNVPGLREITLEAVNRGQCETGSLLPEYAQVLRADGTTGAWTWGIDIRGLEREIQILRIACYLFVTGLSMMRDSEVQEITKGSVVEYYGAPAVVSAEIKGEEDFPRKHWWIIEPVARALAMAEAITSHSERLFTGIASNRDAEVFNAGNGIKAFVAHINARCEVSGLEPIPAERLAPHMFRRTMAMLTDQFPGSEIALGIQLKHVAARALANRTTQGYAATAASWASHLDEAIEAARFRGLRDLFEAHHANEPIGFGSGAEQLSRTFDKIRDTVAAQGGDATVEHALLKQARISIRFGTLNNCLFDEANPSGALCLENTVIPPGHSGPLPDRCRPDRCGNSMIGPQHVEIWASEERSLAKLLESRRLAPGHRAALEQQQVEARAVLRKADR
ncbi:integrase [Streptomyces sp. NPDC091280]|uniref:integrase n=1 Tax=Streptomyces sp. NPDC091280 TaxID=3365984 RepID=UPI00380EFA6F